jgi:predicted acylesterase/phospholipase RssA
MATPATRQREEEHLVGMLRSEIEAINERRRALGRDELPVRAGCEPPAQVIEAVGLALSGGGIRSAAVSLGALQALNHHGVLRNIDYLSTVSGGGFIGTSLTVTMTKDDGRFVFGLRHSPRRSAIPTKSDTSEITPTTLFRPARVTS